MADLEYPIARQLRATSKKRKAPWREFEGQVEMFAHGINAKSEHSDLDKGWIGYGNARLPEKRADVEFDLVGAANYAVAVGDSMFEMTIRRAFPFGNETGFRLQPAQPHRQPSRRHAARDINRMDGNTTRFIPTGHTRHPLALSSFARAEYHGNRAAHSTTMPTAEPLDDAGRG